MYEDIRVYGHVYMMEMRPVSKKPFNFNNTWAKTLLINTKGHKFALPELCKFGLSSKLVT